VDALVVDSNSPALRTIGLTVVAMAAFAANSVLCRLALAHGSIDPATFTFVRITAGAAMLWCIVAFTSRSRQVQGSWRAAFALFFYAAAFSFAYVSLSAGTGALLLFGVVQATMVATGLKWGQGLSRSQWLGFALAMSGLAALVAPGVSAPPLVGACLMLAAGIAWGAYSLFGRGVIDPLAATAGNFLRALPMAVGLVAIGAAFGAKASWSGLVYAALSGALASGLGYTVWYAALRGLTPAQGASVQLSVPVIAAVVGGLVLGEVPTLRLGGSSVAILGGIALVIGSRKRAIKGGSVIPSDCKHADNPRGAGSRL